MIADKAALVLCPICSAENHRDAARCFLCGQSLVGAEVAAAKKRGGGAGTSRWRTLPLNWMILLTAVVIMGVAFVAPGLAPLGMIIATIALFRIVASFRPGRSGFDSGVIAVAVFGLVILVAFAAFLAFCSACEAIFPSRIGR